MKLLPKSEVSKRKAAAQKQSIDEGVKMAKRVDSLREIALDEEASLEEWRTKTLAEIHAELEVENQKLEGVKAERRDAEKARDEALKPLNDEWAKVAEQKAELSTRWDELSDAIAVIEKRDEESRERSEEITKASAVSKTREELSIDKLRQADKAEQKAKLLLGEIEKIRIHEQVSLDEKKAYIKTWTKNLEEREQALKIREERIAEERETLNGEKKKLYDREQTLERNIKRIKK